MNGWIKKGQHCPQDNVSELSAQQPPDSLGWGRSGCPLGWKVGGAEPQVGVSEGGCVHWLGSIMQTNVGRWLELVTLTCTTHGKNTSVLEQVSMGET